MNNKLHPMSSLLMIIVLISLSECIGQSCLKKLFSEPTRRHLFIVAVVFYSLVCYLLVMSYKYKGMGIVNVLWSGMSILLIVSIGVIFYNEKLTPLDIAGILLIFAGIACVVWEGGHEGFH